MASELYDVVLPDGTVRRGVSLAENPRDNDRFSLEGRDWIVKEAHLPSEEAQARSVVLVIHVELQEPEAAAIVLSGWDALVHFPDETKVVTVFETPRDGAELVGDFPKGWIARDVKFREGDLEGEEFQLELQAKRAE